MAVIAVLQRLVIPVILLAAVIGAGIAADRLGNDPLPEATTGVDVQQPDTPVFSIRRAPDLLTSERAVEELNSSLDGWVASLPPNSCFVVSSGAEVIYSHQADLPLTPASNMKLLTAVAALQALGTDYTFDTRVAALQLPDENGFLNGDLYLIGGGDPLLRSDAYLALLPDGYSDIHTSVEQMADQTVATNIADISGGVRVDESRYDNERAPLSVGTDLLDAALLGSLGAGIVDEGFIGLEDGYASQIVEAPEPGAVDENGNPIPTPDPPPLPRADEPAREFAARFDDLLEARNVRISGRADVSPDTPTDQLVDLFTISSPPLAQIVEQMLTNSDNTTAELLVKELGFTASENGTTTAGTLALTDVLRGAGLNDAGLFALDGSGLSDGNRATCTVIHDALNSVHRNTLRDSLPVAGESGTLIDDFVNTPGEGRIIAKTGFLSTASALSGYYTTDRGVELTFSLIINAAEGETISPDQVAGWQRPLPRLLAPYPSGPGIDELGPVGVTLDGG